MAETPGRRRRADDDDTDLPPDPRDDDEDAERPDYDIDEGVRHARQRARLQPVDDADDDEADDDQTIPDRVVKLPLPKPWNRLRIYAWLDFPEEVAVLFGPKRDDETADDAGERIIDGLRQCITRHDGWRDRDGKLPQPDSRAFWRRISTPLSKAIMEAFFAAIRRNPTAGASTSKRPRSSRRT